MPCLPGSGSTIGWDVDQGPGQGTGWETDGGGALRPIGKDRRATRRTEHRCPSKPRGGVAPRAHCDCTHVCSVYACPVLSCMCGRYPVTAQCMCGVCGRCPVTAQRLRVGVVVRAARVSQHSRTPKTKKLRPLARFPPAAASAASRRPGSPASVRASPGRHPPPPPSPHLPAGHTKSTRKG